MVRFPLWGPQILMYAVESAPSSDPKTAHMAESRKPRPKTAGPKRPTARLFMEMFAENQSSATETSSQREGGLRSSGCTRVMPRASKPERPSIQLLSWRSLFGAGMWTS
jgi:hypothetical protein